MSDDYWRRIRALNDWQQLARDECKALTIEMERARALRDALVEWIDLARTTRARMRRRIRNLDKVARDPRGAL